MKPSLILGALMLPFAGSALAANYSTDFESPPFGAPGSDVNGQDGWSASNTTDQYSQIAQANVNYDAPTSISRVLNFGDASAVTTPPVTSSVTLSHAFTGAIGGTSINFDFLLADSFTGPFSNRDQFGVGISTGTTNILSIFFSPRTQAADPNTDEAQWDLFYKLGGGSSVALNISAFELAQYKFELGITENAGNSALSDFSVSVSSSINVLTDGATGVAIDPSATRDAINIIWAKHEGGDYGSNQIFIDNLAAIPEPSAAILGLLGVLGILRRRRA